MTGSPKRHHFIPKRYLEGFCRDGFLSVYDREKGEYRRQTPKNTALQTHYYSLEDEHGRRASRPCTAPASPRFAATG